MRYHTEKPSQVSSTYGEVYFCKHPVYSVCTLFRIGDRGLAVIQQRCENKRTFWTAIDEWLNDILYLDPGFKVFFDKRGGPCVNGLYPTVTIRQIMWALRMKPLKREPWETYFDRKLI